MAMVHSVCNVAVWQEMKFNMGMFACSSLYVRIKQERGRTVLLLWIADKQFDVA